MVLPVLAVGLLMAVYIGSSFTSGHQAKPNVRMVRIPGSVPPALKRAAPMEKTGMARAEADEPIAVTVVLRRDRQKAFERYRKEIYQPHSPDYRHFLTQRQIADRFGPSRADYEQVLDYMRGNGFRLLQGSKNRLTLTMQGTRAIAERAFDVRIRDYRLGSRKFHANALDPALPAGIAPHVQAIVGLSNLARPQHVGAGDTGQWVWNQIPSQAQTLLECFSPAAADAIKNLSVDTAPGLDAAIAAVTAPVACELSMIAAYAASYGKFPDPTPGAGQTIGLLEFDNYYPSDVQNYLDLMGVGSRISQLSEVNVGGGAGTPGAGESEVLLDIDIAMRLAPGANVTVYDGPFTGAGSFPSMFNAMINGGVNVISNSWATCEDQEPPADLLSVDSVLQSAATAGITVITGSGDNGSTCLDGSPNTVAVPADSPNVTAVGGTTATPNVAGVYQSEQWWDGSTHTPPTGQGGFGVSNFFGPVTYQSSLTSALGRSVPDVVSPADPAEGWVICEADKGGCPAPLRFGGTSAAAPIWAAFVAVLNQELGHNLGFLNPTLYKLAGTSAFHSAASMGSNFAHVGLGSPNVNELRRLLAGGTTGAVDLANSGIVAPAIPVVADGTSKAPVSVTLLDSNFYTVSGQNVTLQANSGSSAVITTVRGATDLNSGAALFEVSDTVPETVTLTASTGAGTLPGTATVTFVSPSATGGSIQTSTPTVTADGTSQATITVTLQTNGNPAPGKVVGLSQGNGSSQISSTNATTDSAGVATFTATDTVAQNVTYTATDITDDNLAVPGSVTVDFTNATAAPPCKIGLGTVASGYAVSTFASGFSFNSSSCVGPAGLAFDPQGNLMVADQDNNVLYKFSPAGGSADPGHEVGPTGLVAVTGLAFGKDGNLYATDPADPSGGVVVELNSSTGVSERTVASSLPGPLGLAVDPLSGNLFFSAKPQFCFSGAGWWEISNFSTGTGTSSLYAPEGSTCINLGGGTDGITFAPDGTIYSVDEYDGDIFTVSGTNGPTPPTVTVIATLSGNPDGIAVAQNPADSSHPFLYVNKNNGSIVKLDTTTSPPTETTIYSGGSRGDFVTVGPDGCMYATQTDRIIKITNADGSCSFEPQTVSPAIALTPAAISPNPTQGSTVTLTAQIKNVATLANVPVQLVVTGANPEVYAGSSDANGQVTFHLTGVHSGADKAEAVFSPNGTAIGSNSVGLQWASGPHSTFIGLNQSPGMGVNGQPITLTGTLVDVSADPNAPLSGQTLNFSLAGQNCTGTTDATGTATCTVTPGTTGPSTLTASFAGNSSYVASSATAPVLVVTPAASTFALTVTTAGAGTGTVTSNSGGIDCSSGSTTGCTADFSSGQTVTLTAAAGSKSVFAGWSGNAACSGTGACTISMTAAESVTATFTLGTPTATLSVPTLTFAPDDVGTTSASQKVTLTNSGNATLTFSGAGIALTGANSDDFSETNTCGASLNAGAQCAITVTFKPTAAGTADASVSITDNAAGSPQSISLSGTGLDFAISATPGSDQVSSGGTATYTITISPGTGGFPNAVTLSATGAPAGATVTFQPGSVTPGNNTSPSTLTIQVPSTSSALMLPLGGAKSVFGTFASGSNDLILFVVILMMSIGLLVALAFGREGERSQLRRLKRFAFSGAFLLAMAIGLAGCSAGFPAPPQATANNYAVTVTGTSGSLQHSTTVTLTVGK